MIFRDRQDAGKQLAEKLMKFRGDNPIILAIPRGGVVVAREIAIALKAELNLIIPRKIGAPYNPELAIGAVTEDGSTILDQDLITYLNVSEKYIESERQKQINEIKRRIEKYRVKELKLKGRIVILIDDGIATGSTMLAAIKSVKNQEAKKIVLAVPVAPPETIEKMKKEVDEIICLYTPEFFNAVGSFYQHFEQTTDEEVMGIIGEGGR